jgi:molecular chaperone DnaK (HSP70)
MSTILGIDLGTTNSLVAVVRQGVPQVLADPDGERLLPSVVYFPPDPHAAPVVGTRAQPFLTSDAARTVYSAKRLMGKGQGDADVERDHYPFALTDDARVDLGDGMSVAAPEVAAQVLAALKARAEAALGEAVDRAVITVPAYFNDAQRQATKDAGALAGLEVVRIVNEPTAAALAYGLQNTQAATIAVYDLGGGTFDISILRLEDGLFEVLATAGDTRLGGDDFDRALVDWLAGTGAPIDRSAARIAAEALKRKLSAFTSAEMLGAAVSRPQFEALIAPFIERTLTISGQALADAGLTVDAIDTVVLVGGSTRVPAVREAVGRFFGCTPHTSLNPDEVVALGAAIQADILSGNRGDTLLLDVTPLSLGIETMGGATEKLIFRNARIPSSAKEEFTTSVDGQTKVLLHVVQGEREMAADNRSLARIELTDIPPMPAGLPKIAVTFLLDANGILQVSAQEARSGVATEVRVKPTYGIDTEEVRARVRESFVHAEDDFQKRMLADMRTEAQAAILGAQKLLPAYAGADKPAIEAALAALIDARDHADDHAQIRSALDALEAAGRPLVEAVMSGIARSLVGGKTLAEAADALGSGSETAQ